MSLLRQMYPDQGCTHNKQTQLARQLLPTLTSDADQVVLNMTVNLAPMHAFCDTARLL
jgi:hypothetical protein